MDFEQLNAISGNVFCSPTDLQLFKNIQLTFENKETNLDSLFDIKKVKQEFILLIEQMKAQLPPPIIEQIEQNLTSGFYAKEWDSGMYSRTSSPRQRRQKRYFSNEEVEYLYEGVARFTAGSWSQILRSYNFNQRTAVDLKDKWRNMNKRNEHEIQAKLKEIRIRLGLPDPDVSHNSPQQVVVSALSNVPDNSISINLDSTEDVSICDETIASSELQINNPETTEESQPRQRSKKRIKKHKTGIH